MRCRPALFRSCAARLRSYVVPEAVLGQPGPRVARQRSTVLRVPCSKQSPSPGSLRASLRPRDRIQSSTSRSVSWAASSAASLSRRCFRRCNQIWRATPAAANSSAPSETRRPIINQRIGANPPRIPDGFIPPPAGVPPAGPALRITRHSCGHGNQATSNEIWTMIEASFRPAGDGLQ